MFHFDLKYLQLLTGQQGFLIRAKQAEEDLQELALLCVIPVLGKSKCHSPPLSIMGDKSGSPEGSYINWEEKQPAA